MEAISGGTITEAKPTTTASPYSAGTRVADGCQGEANLDAGSRSRASRWTTTAQRSGWFARKVMVSFA